MSDIEKTEGKVRKFIKGAGAEIQAAVVMIASLVLGVDLSQEADQLQEIALRATGIVSAALVGLKGVYNAILALVDNLEDTFE